MSNFIHFTKINCPIYLKDNKFTLILLTSTKIKINNIEIEENEMMDKIEDMRNKKRKIRDVCK